MSLLLFFIDGLGIGERNDFNPLSPEEDNLPLAIFRGEEPKLLYDGVLVRTDADEEINHLLVFGGFGVIQRGFIVVFITNIQICPKIH